MRIMVDQYYKSQTLHIGGNLVHKLKLKAIRLSTDAGVTINWTDLARDILEKGVSE